MKTRVEEANRNIYDIVTENETEKTVVGLTEESIREISKYKNEPDWILDIRLKALKYFNDDLYTEENGNYMILDWIE